MIISDYWRFEPLIFSTLTRQLPTLALSQYTRSPLLSPRCSDFLTFWIMWSGGGKVYFFRWHHVDANVDRKIPWRMLMDREKKKPSELFISPGSVQNSLCVYVHGTTSTHARRERCVSCCCFLVPFLLLLHLYKSHAVLVWPLRSTLLFPLLKRRDGSIKLSCRRVAGCHCWGNSVPDYGIWA